MRNVDTCVFSSAFVTKINMYRGLCAQFSYSFGTHEWLMIVITKCWCFWNVRHLQNRKGHIGAVWNWTEFQISFPIFFCYPWMQQIWQITLKVSMKHDVVIQRIGSKIKYWSKIHVFCFKNRGLAPKWKVDPCKHIFDTILSLPERLKCRIRGPATCQSLLSWLCITFFKAIFGWTTGLTYATAWQCRIRGPATVTMWLRVLLCFVQRLSWLDSKRQSGVKSWLLDCFDLTSLTSLTSMMKYKNQFQHFVSIRTP